MPAPFISSDPHAWLRPYYVELVRRGGFGLLAPALQWDALVDAFSVDYPAKVADYRAWNDLGQRSLLSWLASVTEQKPAVRETELWRMSKADRQLRCIAVYLPTGIDMRLMEGDDFRRTQLVTNAPAAHKNAAKWQALLRSGGWH